jgi:SAM-dependent methyltransferase
MGRELSTVGHRVIGVDVTFTLAHAAASHAQPLDLIVGDAARLPLRDSAADLVVAFMSLMDTDDFKAAIQEAARVLDVGGRYCFAIVHPLAESGRVQDDGAFLLDRPYLGVWRYPDAASRQGGEATFHTEHRPIGAYARALEDAGFVIEVIRESVLEDSADPDEERQRRVPNFLMVRARLDLLAGTAGTTIHPSADGIEWWPSS